MRPSRQVVSSPSCPCEGHEWRRHRRKGRAKRLQRQQNKELIQNVDSSTAENTQLDVSTVESAQPNTKSQQKRERKNRVKNPPTQAFKRLKITDEADAKKTQPEISTVENALPKSKLQGPQPVIDQLRHEALGVLEELQSCKIQAEDLRKELEYVSKTNEEEIHELEKSYEVIKKMNEEELQDMEKKNEILKGEARGLREELKQKGDELQEMEKKYNFLKGDAREELKKKEDELQEMGRKYEILKKKEDELQEMGRKYEILKKIEAEGWKKEALETLIELEKNHKEAEKYKLEVQCLRTKSKKDDRVKIELEEFKRRYNEGVKLIESVKSAYVQLKQENTTLRLKLVN